MTYRDEWEESLQFTDTEVFYSDVVDNEESEMWVFSYGSLLWYPNFDSDKRYIGFVRGLKRCLSHASLRFGDPSWMGRVATLIPCESSLTWGAVYRICGRSKKIPAYEHLFEREIQQNYVLAYTNFECMEPRSTFKVAVYISPPECKSELVEVSTEQQAYQILKAHGELGPNKPYVQKIANFLQSEVIPHYPEAKDAQNDITIQLSTIMDEIESGKRKIPENYPEICIPRYIRQ